MHLSNFYFDLPDELIARYPKVERTSSRLLQLNGQNGELFHRTFSDIADLINEGDLLIFNNTRVIPARIFGSKASGGKIEVLIERILTENRFFSSHSSLKIAQRRRRVNLGRR